MRRKILLFSRDPGGANTIIPLVRPLEEKGHNIRLFGKDTALGKYAKADLKAFNIMDFIQDVELSSIEKFLADENPDLIITGTSADDFTEKFIWKSAEKLKIPSFAIIDQWMNCGLRFSPYGVSELEKYNLHKTYPYLPTKILVMDETAKRDSIKEGLEEKRLVITGQPHFESLLKSASAVTFEDMKLVRSGFGASQHDFLITFASEPIVDTYHETGSSKHYWGYTERTIFENLLESLRNIADSSGRRVFVVLRPHPKENKDNWNDYLSGFSHDRIRVIKDSDTDSIKLILSSDLVCGMSSMFLLESAILGRSVMSIQIGLKRENPFVLDRIGVLKSMLDRDELRDKIKSAILENSLPACSFEFIRNPVENIINLMEMHLCRN